MESDFYPENYIEKKKPKLIILGYARHGKDTVAEILRDECGFTFVSSSLFCAERVMLPYFAAQGVNYNSVADCYADRVNHRAAWFDQIGIYNSDDGARLCKGVFDVADIYVGMRSERELKAATPMADLIVWVDASGRGLPPEDKSSCTVGPEMADIIISNGGTLEDLTKKVVRVFNKLTK